MSIADMLVQSGLQSSRETVDIGGSIQKGAALAQTIEQMEQSRATLEQKKQELQMNKAVAVTDTLKIAAQTKDKNLKNFLLKKVMPGKIKALGMEEFFGPQTLEMLQTSDAALEKVLGLQLDLEDKVNKGEITGAQAYQQARDILNNPEDLALLDTDRLFEAQKFSVAESGKSQRVEQQGNIQFGKQVQAQNASGQVKLSEDIGKRYADYAAGGGRSSFDASLGKLKEAANALETGEVKTGGISTKIPGFKSDDAQSLVNPEMVAMKTNAQSALNSILRQTLGAQFTEQEGLRVLNQVWDDRQPPAVNAKKIRAKVNELEANIKNAEAEFKRFGYLKDGGISADVKKKLASKKDAYKKLPPDEQKKFVEKLRDMLNTSEDEILKGLQ